MSRRIRESDKQKSFAPKFAALGAETRLSRVETLRGSANYFGTLPRNKTDPPGNHTPLGGARKSGPRKKSTPWPRNFFELEKKPFEELKSYLVRASDRWDQALSRLKLFARDK